MATKTKAKDEAHDSAEREERRRFWKGAGLGTLLFLPLGLLWLVVSTFVKSTKMVSDVSKDVTGKRGE